MDQNNLYIVPSCAECVVVYVHHHQQLAGVASRPTPVYQSLFTWVLLCHTSLLVGVTTVEFIQIHPTTPHHICYLHPYNTLHHHICQISSTPLFISVGECEDEWRESGRRVVEEGHTWRESGRRRVVKEGESGGRRRLRVEGHKWRESGGRRVVEEEGDTWKRSGLELRKMANVLDRRGWKAWLLTRKSDVCFSCVWVCLLALLSPLLYPGSSSHSN
ncbi:hypothetical protein Pmani_032630 [Petrolisthes manimaculis]|uniref:Uncharacterized protein n=1 Tax=Petrolisthes manimaculis TaxID=1843537 RepID=A0AAE1TQW8_9EUCA|nr:hypothetical protein Pmani_032630 [Petrolisthes manimaculis]